MYTTPTTNKETMTTLKNEVQRALHGALDEISDHAFQRLTCVIKCVNCWGDAVSASELNHNEIIHRDDCVIGNIVELINKEINK